MTIIVGFIPTAEGRAALDRAIAEAELRSSRLVVITTVQGGKGFDEAEEAEAAQLLADVRSQLEAKGIQHEERELVRGNDPATDVLDVAKEESAELIVVGVRRRSPVGKLLLGSNAQRIILDAECPVLAVKG